MRAHHLDDVHRGQALDPRAVCPSFAHQRAGDGLFLRILHMDRAQQERGGAHLIQAFARLNKGDLVGNGIDCGKFEWVKCRSRSKERDAYVEGRIGK